MISLFKTILVVLLPTFLPDLFARGTLGSSLRSPAEVDGTQGFLPQPEKDLESPALKEGRRGSEEAVPGPSVFPSGEPGVSGDFWGWQEGCQGPFRPSGRKRGPELWRQCGVSHEVRRGVQVASRVAPGKSGLHGRGKGERVIALQSG